MSSVITVRGVPDDVKAALVEQARERGQSLQALVLHTLQQQAAFSRNRQIIAEIEEELSKGGGAGPDAPRSWEVLEQERARRT